MSCAELLYPCFQAFDFLHLHTHHNCWMQVSLSPSLPPSLSSSPTLWLCRVQVGGGDQWGNITAGCEFVRKKTGDVVHGEWLLELLMLAVVLGV